MPASLPKKLISIEGYEPILTNPRRTPQEAVELQGECLRSWKEIAVYLHREVRTVQRWEKHENMPVHRQIHRAGATIFAFTDELDYWLRCRSLDRSLCGKPSATRHSAEERKRLLVQLLEQMLLICVGSGCLDALIMKHVVEGRFVEIKETDFVTPKDENTYGLSVSPPALLSRMQ